MNFICFLSDYHRLTNWRRTTLEVPWSGPLIWMTSRALSVTRVNSPWLPPWRMPWACRAPVSYSKRVPKVYKCLLPLKRQLSHLPTSMAQRASSHFATPLLLLNFHVRNFMLVWEIRSTRLSFTGLFSPKGVLKKWGWPYLQHKHLLLYEPFIKSLFHSTWGDLTRNP